MFTTIHKNSNDKLLVGTIPDTLNTKIETIINNITPILKNDHENSWFNRVFDNEVDMNEGLHYNLLFNKEYLEMIPEYAEIIDQAYHFLAENGFCVQRYNGMLQIDIYDINTPVPVSTCYGTEICDNDIFFFNRYFHSCIFYARKDDGVKGDIEIYTKPSGFFEDGETFCLPTVDKMVMLRNGSLCYEFQPHSGKGKEMIFSVFFDVDED